MANVLSKPSQKANIGYNGFDMSQMVKFSSTTGELLPVYYDLLYPGDKVTAHVEHRTRTMPLDSAAMCSIEEHFDWFAVPLDQIFSLSSQYLLNIRDVHSSIFRIYDYDGENHGFDRMPCLTGESFSHMFETLREREDKYFTYSDNDINLKGSRKLYGTGVRLFELLGIPLRDYANEYDADDSSLTKAGFPFMVNPMFACAYQKIYYDYFRDSDRESNNPWAYNLDAFYEKTYLDNTDAEHSGCDFFTLRYRSMRPDFFTHNYVSPLFDPDGSLAFPTPRDGQPIANISNLYHQWLSGNGPVQTQGLDDSFTPQAPDDFLPLEYGSPNPTTVSLFDSNQYTSTALNVANIRTAFAVNKLLEVTRRAGKHVDAQILAHFGVDVPKRVAGEVIHLGHSSSTIVVGEVVSTAETEDAALGKIAGKGYNKANSGKITYENHEPCPVILMCIYSAAPVVDYRVTGLDKFHTYVNRADFFMPEFDNLGMQPLFAFQTRLHDDPEDNESNSDVIGWQYRWMESKCKANKICGSLARTLDYWTTYRDNINATLTSRLVSPFDLNSIMTAVYNFDARDGHSKMDVWADDVSLFDGDPLIHECYFNVKKASKMSSYGLEQL